MPRESVDCAPVRQQQPEGYVLPPVATKRSAAADEFGRGPVLLFGAVVLLVTALAVMPVPGVAALRTAPGPRSYRPRLRSAATRPKP